jgi:hypothetical protein
VLLEQGRLPECWIPPAQILECRALLEAYHDLRREHTAWIERIHAVFFHGKEHSGARPQPGHLTPAAQLEPLAVPSRYR